MVETNVATRKFSSRSDRNISKELKLDDQRLWRVGVFSVELTHNTQSRDSGGHERSWQHT